MNWKFFEILKKILSFVGHLDPVEPKHLIYMMNYETLDRDFFNWSCIGCCLLDKISTENVTKTSMKNTK